jgi:hypothetical protein
MNFNELIKILIDCRARAGPVGPIAVDQSQIHGDPNPAPQGNP